MSWIIVMVICMTANGHNKVELNCMTTIYDSKIYQNEKDCKRFLKGYDKGLTCVEVKIVEGAILK